jgi:hypothetical protein
MAKAIRYKHNGQYLQNTLFWSQAAYVGTYHGGVEDFDPKLAAIEEAQAIESHKQDFAIAFGVPADEIECEVVPWDGRDETLPFTSDNSAPIRRIPENQREGYVKPEPHAPTLDDIMAVLSREQRSALEARMTEPA